MNPQTRTLILVGMLCAALSATALPPTGTISGIVIGLDGNSVAGARVTLQASTGRNPQTRITDKEGRFHFRELPRGLYDLRANAQGLVSDWHHNVLLQVDKNVEVELHLQPKKSPKSSGHSKP